MARQKVTIPNALPEFLGDEPQLSAKQRRYAQAKEQLDREEAALHAEYDAVITTASGPIPSDWLERWTATRERRQALTRTALQVNAARNFQRQVAEHYLTPTMVLAPGQRPLPQVRENGTVTGHDDEQHAIRIIPVPPDQQPPRRQNDAFPVTISGELRVEVDSQTGERGAYYFGPDEFIGRHYVLEDETIIVARSSDPLPTQQDTDTLPAEQREEVLENGWQGTVQGFDYAAPGASRQVRGIRVDSIIVDDAQDIDPAIAARVSEGMAAAARERGERNDRLWETVLRGQPAPVSERTQDQQRQMNEQLLNALGEDLVSESRGRRAANAINDFTRAQMRRESMAHHVLPPMQEVMGAAIGNVRGLARADFEGTPPTAERLTAENPAPVFRDISGVSDVVTPPLPAGRGVRFYPMHDTSQQEPRRIKRQTVIIRGPEELQSE